MKKIIPFLIFIGTIVFQGCTVHESYYTTTSGDTENPVIEVTTSFNAANNFSRLVTITPPIYSSDVILVYHMYDVYDGTPLWRLLPQKYYLEYGAEVDYNFDFTKYDVNIFMESNIDMTNLSPVWTDNQTFRIVIIPGYFSGKSPKSVDLNDYYATVKAYGINSNNIKKIK